MRIRPLALATASAILASLGAASTASATIEVKTSPYVFWPGNATVKVRTTVPGVPIEFRQERLDRRRVGKLQQTAGWDCTVPVDTSKPRFQPGYRVVARVANPAANTWITVRIPAAALEYTSSIQQDLVALTQPKGWAEEGCVDPTTQYTRIQAKQSANPDVYEIGGAALTRGL